MKRENISELKEELNITEDYPTEQINRLETRMHFRTPDCSLTILERLEHILINQFFQKGLPFDNYNKIKPVLRYFLVNDKKGEVNIKENKTDYALDAILTAESDFTIEHILEKINLLHSISMEWVTRTLDNLSDIGLVTKNDKSYQLNLIEITNLKLTFYELFTTKYKLLAKI